VIHVDDPEKVTNEPLSFAADGGADALFVEMPDEMIDPTTLARSALRAPLYFLGLLAVGLFFQMPLSSTTTASHARPNGSPSSDWSNSATRLSTGSTRRCSDSLTWDRSRRR